MLKPGRFSCRCWISTQKPSRKRTQNRRRQMRKTSSSPHSNDIKAELLQTLSPAVRREVIGELSEREATALLYDWEFWARPAQLAPPGDWVNWLILAGRGFGKTRVGAEQV